MQPDHVIRAYGKEAVLLEGPGNQQHIGLAVDVYKLHWQRPGACIDQLPQLFGLVKQVLIPDYLAALVRLQAEVDLSGGWFQLQRKAMLWIVPDKLLIRPERLELIGVSDPDAGRPVLIKFNEQLCAVQVHATKVVGPGLAACYRS